MFAQLGSWGLRHRHTNHALRVRAQLLEDGGPALWDEYMNELRALHLGNDSDPPHPTVSERLQQAYSAALRDASDEGPGLPTTRQVSR